MKKRMKSILIGTAIIVRKGVGCGRTSFKMSCVPVQRNLFVPSLNLVRLRSWHNTRRTKSQRRALTSALNSKKTEEGVQAEVEKANWDKLEYHKCSSAALDSIADCLEEDVDVNDNLEDVEITPDVITISGSGKVGTWVINKHTATEQIWLSSPVSGPKKFVFDHTADKWVNERDKAMRLHTLLSKEFSQALELTRGLREF